MPRTDREVRLRLSVERALAGQVSSALAAVSCGLNENDITLEFLIDPEFTEEDRDRMEVVASEVVADFRDENINTVFTPSSTDRLRVAVDGRCVVYQRGEKDANFADSKLEWPFVVLALVDRLFQERVSWPYLIKEIRHAAEVDILTAEKIALSHNGWRRLCAYRINHEPECKKQAASHIKIHGASSLILSVDRGFVIVDPSCAWPKDDF